MNMLSPLIWVWPAGSIRKVLFPGRLLARAELSGLGFTPVLHSQGFYFEARVSLSSPTSPQTCLTGWTRCGLLTRLQKSFICAFRRSNLDLIKGACLLILFTGKAPANSHHWRALWLKLEATHWGLWYPFIQSGRHCEQAVMRSSGNASCKSIKGVLRKPFFSIYKCVCIKYVGTCNLSKDDIL